MSSSAQTNIVTTLPKCISGFDVLARIGSGSFADVYKGIGRSNTHGLRMTVAIKCIPRKFALTNQDRIITEISLLKCCKHKHIVQYVDLSWDKSWIFIIMEFCGGGHLGAFIQQNRSLSEELSQDIFHQLSLALSYMWKRHITHMDLKPQNILIANRMKMCIKVADFGLSQLMTDEGQTAFRGSPLYMAPEIYTIQKYDGTVDLWSAGVILYECIFGRAPFSSDSMEQVISQLLSPDPIEIPQAQISYECRDLLGRLLIRDPQQRINFENFFAHPFVAIDILAEDRNLAQARKLVNQASVDEQLGDLSSTSQLLQEAVELYLKCLDESENNSEKKALRQKINEYLTKAETVKKRLGNSSCGLSKTAIQTRSRTRNDKSSINDQPYTSALKNLRLGSDVSKIVSRSQSLIRQARKAWSNSDGKTALSKYSEAIEIALESARQETTSAEMKNQLREKVSKWLSEAEEIKVSDQFSFELVFAIILIALLIVIIPSVYIYYNK